MIFTRYKNKFIFKNLGNVKDKDYTSPHSSDTVLLI